MSEFSLRAELNRFWAASVNETPREEKRQVAEEHIRLETKLKKRQLEGIPWKPAAVAPPPPTAPAPFAPPGPRGPPEAAPPAPRPAPRASPALAPSAAPAVSSAETELENPWEHEEQLWRSDTGPKHSTGARAKRQRAEAEWRQQAGNKGEQALKKCRIEEEEEEEAKGKQHENCESQDGTYQQQPSEIAPSEQQVRQECYVGNIRNCSISAETIRNSFCYLFNLLPQYRDRYGRSHPVCNVFFPPHQHIADFMYCFVKFLDPVVAETAILMDGFLLNSYPIEVKWSNHCRKKVGVEPLDVKPLRNCGAIPAEADLSKCRELFIGGLPADDVSEKMIRDFLQPICAALQQYQAHLGPPFDKITMPNAMQPSVRTSYCFVLFQNAEMASALIHVLDGRYAPWGKKLKAMRRNDIQCMTA